MLTALTTGATGTVVATSPDTCKTPQPPFGAPAPIPYPNTGMCATSLGVGFKVLVDSMPVVVEGCKLPASLGDQAGVAGGVVSGIFSGEIGYKMYSSRVSADGKKVVYLSALTGHNGANPNAPIGAVATPSQLRVLVSP